MDVVLANTLKECHILQNVFCQMGIDTSVIALKGITTNPIIKPATAKDDNLTPKGQCKCTRNRMAIISNMLPNTVTMKKEPSIPANKS